MRFFNLVRMVVALQCHMAQFATDLALWTIPGVNWAGLVVGVELPTATTVAVVASVSLAMRAISTSPSIARNIVD